MNALQLNQSVQKIQQITKNTLLSYKYFLDRYTDTSATFVTNNDQ